PSASVTPKATATPSQTATPEAEIKTVAIDKYIKGVMLACVGTANFSDPKYKEGFKALGVAAYTLLLHEIKSGVDCDIAVNGYTDTQKYYIPYVDFDAAQAAGSVKARINDAVKEITITVKDEASGDLKYYIKAFWFDTIKNKKERFKKDVSIGGKTVTWPDIKTLIFRYGQYDENNSGSIDSAERANIIIRSAKDVIGNAYSYLTETKYDEPDTGIPAGLKSGTKCGMSAWGAMIMSPNFKADLILRRFYHWAPAVAKKVVIKEIGASAGAGEGVKYASEWGAARVSDGAVIRDRVSGVLSKGLETNKSYEVAVYFTDYIIAPLLTLKSADKKINVPLPATIDSAGEDGYPCVARTVLTNAQYGLLLAGKKDTVQAILGIDAIDELMLSKSDHMPETVACVDGSNAGLNLETAG
ncbi:MAG TPA: hypothetical protein P5511_09160, partial [Candidatus Goldiibacteriota bacterium]|nr:hypothetical protein [Candidatus Goldiibacteriota bacterium]